MAKEIIDAVKEAELNGRYNVENAKDEAAGRVSEAAQEFSVSSEVRILEAKKAAQAKLENARTMARDMLERAEDEAVKERDSLRRSCVERRARASESVISFLFG